MNSVALFKRVKLSKKLYHLKMMIVYDEKKNNVNKRIGAVLRGANERERTPLPV